MSRPDQRSLRNRVRIVEVLLAVIVIVGAVIIGDSIVTGSVFRSPYRVSVELPEAAGLHTRSDVAYRGQHIGLVTDVRLTASGVRVSLAIDHGTRVPRDSEYVVANLSPVGEQYLDIRPRTASGPFLRAGDRVDGSKAVLPLPVWKLLADTQSILKRIDVADIRTISREVDAAFGQKDLDLRGLIDQLDRSLDLAERLTPQALALLADAERPLRTMGDLSGPFRTFVGNARTISAALRRSDPALGRLIDQGAVVIPVIADQFTRTSPALVSLLRSGTPVAEMARDHLRGLQHWYAWTPRQLKAMATSTRDGAAHVVLVLTAAENCKYGAEVSPYDATDRLPLSARCTTVDPDIQQRGAQNVPRQ
ncbi:MAG: hypothetical protein JWQ74_1280 [Marmoricola sp.]|nr:hypothetical protein [Marmoricola sp.]